MTQIHAQLKAALLTYGNVVARCRGWRNCKTFLVSLRNKWHYDAPCSAPRQRSSTSTWQGHVARIRNLAVQIAPPGPLRRFDSAASPCNTPQYEAVQRLYKSLRSGCHAAPSHLPTLDLRFRGLTDGFRTPELRRISAELRPAYF
eukprot:jgi/Botrbrau1/14518/Bobra.0223s0008.1